MEIQMKLKYDVFVSELGGSYVGVIVGNGFREHRGLLKMNGTGASILRKLRREISGEELIAAMAEEYPAETEETVENVVKGFVQKLTDAGLIEA